MTVIPVLVTLLLSCKNERKTSEVSKPTNQPTADDTKVPERPPAVAAPQKQVNQSHLSENDATAPPPPLTPAITSALENLFELSDAHLEIFIDLWKTPSHGALERKLAEIELKITDLNKQISSLPKPNVSDMKTLKRIEAKLVYIRNSKVKKFKNSINSFIEDSPSLSVDEKKKAHAEANDLVEQMKNGPTAIELRKAEKKIKSLFSSMTE